MAERVKEAQDAGRDSGAAAVTVTEPPLPRRARRPADLAGLVVVLAVLGGLVTIGDVAAGTATSLEQDLIGEAGQLPGLLLQLLAWVAGVAELALPVAVVVDLLVRSRLWQLVDVTLAAGLGIGLASALSVLVRHGYLDAMRAALTKTLPDGTRSPAMDALLVASVAVLTVAQIAGRPLLTTGAVLVLGSATVTSFLSGSITAMALVCSALVGLVAGLAVRYGLGAAATRPAGVAVASALVSSGVALRTLTLIGPTERGVRRYSATTATDTVMVHVLDRDTFGSGVVPDLLRRLRLRGPWTRAPAFSVRAALEHRVLMAVVLERIGVCAPRLVAACEVDPFAAAVAYRLPQGPTLRELAGTPARPGPSRVQRGTGPPPAAGPPGVTDEQLAALWGLLARLNGAKVAHRGLEAGTIVLPAADRVALNDVGDGDVAASDVALLLDLNQLLSTVALKVGADRAVDSAVQVLGVQPVVRALPLLQSVALGRSTRAALRHRRQLLREIRARILALAPAGQPVEYVEPRRLTPRGLITVVGGAVAAYILLSQLAQVNLLQILTTANWTWGLVGVVFSAFSFVGACLALTGASPTRLRFGRTYMTQLAVGFTGLVAPGAVGNVAVNTRYLQRAGVDATVAAASVGLAQLAQFCSYVTLLAVSSVVAGTGLGASVRLPPVAVLALIGIAVVFLIVLALPASRRLLRQRFVPLVQHVVPRVVSVFQHPRKVVALFGGAVLLDVSFVAALTCATRAFGVTPAIPTVAVVYFAGAIIGSALPTPGGLGGVEAALSAGLVAAGIGSSAAVSSVLLFRLMTYWLPIPLGWLSLNHLQRVHAL